MFLLDLDYFKLVNDGYGHGAGGQMLARVGTILRKVLREGDWAGRWGGEEFLCLLPETGSEEALRVAERLRCQIASEAGGRDGRFISITGSIGVASYPDDGDRTDVLLAHIDSALYQAKNEGRNQIVRANGGVPGIFFIGHQIEEALAQTRVQPAYQPIVELQGGRVVAEEALARLLHPDGSAMPAGQFIGAASRLQIVHRIDHAVIEQVISRCVARTLAGEAPLLHFVNLSVDLLHYPQEVAALLDSVQRGCAACGEHLGVNKPLVIEITERGALEHPQEAVRLLQLFLNFGLRLALDDFGSGYSSFLYLTNLPVSFLKIEMELVRCAGHDARTLAMVKGIQHIARELGLTTIAKGIEDEATARQMREVGVDWGQGYYFGGPALPAGE